MEKITERAVSIFNESINDYHILNSVDAIMQEKNTENVYSSLFYQKNWIDTVQWHLEDEIRNPSIDPAKALLIKRRIDKLNQERTDMVEKIDDLFFERFSEVSLMSNVSINTETPAWSFDRLSILCLKIYHMKEETLRKDVDDNHLQQCKHKLSVLLLQQNNLCQSIEELLLELEKGHKKMVLYKQMKMYNDPNLNPVLYKKSLLTD